MGTFTYDPAPTEMNWRSLFAAWYAEDTIRVDAEADGIARVPRGIFDRLERGARPGRQLLLHERRDQSDSAHWEFRFQHQQRKVSARAADRSGVEPVRHKTVLRAGFGMYNELQDALGYRMDQNAPFNPTYAISSLPLRIFPSPFRRSPLAAKLRRAAFSLT